MVVPWYWMYFASWGYFFGGKVEFTRILFSSVR